MLGKCFIESDGERECCFHLSNQFMFVFKRDASVAAPTVGLGSLLRCLRLERGCHLSYISIYNAGRDQNLPALCCILGLYHENASGICQLILFCKA